MPDFENAAPIPDNYDPAVFEQRINPVREDDFFEEKKEEDESFFNNGDGYGYEDEEEEKKKKIGVEQEHNSNECAFVPFDSDEQFRAIFDKLTPEQQEQLNKKGTWVSSTQDNENFYADLDGDGKPGTQDELDKTGNLIPFEQQYLLDNLPEGKYVTHEDLQKIHKDYLAIKNDKSLSGSDEKREAYADATRQAALDDLIKNAPTYDALALQKEQFAKGDRANSYKVYRKSDSNKLVETTIGSRTLNEALKQKIDKNQRTIGKIEGSQGQSKHTVKGGVQQFISGEAEQMSKGTLVMTAGAALLLIGFLREKGLEKANEILKEDAAKGIQLKDGMTLEQALKEVMDEFEEKFGKQKPEPDSGREDLEDDSLLEEENKEEQKEEPEEDISNFLEENDKDESSKEEPNNELENPELEQEISSNDEKDMFDELADDLNDSAAPTGEPIDMENSELEEAIDEIGME